MQPIDRLLHRRNPAAQFGAFQSGGYRDVALQILAADFRLAGDFGNVGQCANSGGLARAAYQGRIADGVERGAGLLGEAHTNGVGTAIGNQRITRRQAIENGGRVLRNLSWSEAKPGRNNRA